MKKARPLNQVRSIDADMLNHITNVQNKFIQSGSILSRLMDFASSVPDFRRTGKGNFRHRLKDIIMLMILGRLCGCVGRADIIEFGKHNIRKIHKMSMLKYGIPSEAKSNEIKAVPLLIDKLDISGKIVTADAMSMQKDIIDKIRKKEGIF